MKARVVSEFLDVEAKCDRSVGDEFECSKERFDAINSTKFGTLVEEVKPAAKAARQRARKAE